MVNYKSHYGWMALGGLLCLLGIVFACKLRDGNRALAQSDTSAPAVNTKTEEPPRMLPPISSAVPPPPAPAPDLTPVVAPVAPEVKDPTPSSPATPTPASEPRPILIPASATVPAGPVDPPVTPSPGSQPLPPISVEKTESKASPPPAPVVPPTVAPPPASVSPVPQTPAEVHPSEPPLAPTPGPVMHFKVPAGGETFKSLARKTLGSSERWGDIHKLNPIYRGDAVIPSGTVLRLPGDACVTDEGESVRPLPTLRARTTTRVKAALPLTGTFPVTVDERKGMTLPRVILEQLGQCDTVLLSPGSDKCLWLTNQSHLDRLQAKLDKSPARESDVRGFKRLYYAQTVKAAVKDGRIVISDKLAAFAGLGAEVVLVGIDDHFEVWDAARWRKYTQAKKAAYSEE